MLTDVDEEAHVYTRKELTALGKGAAFAMSAVVPGHPTVEPGSTLTLNTHDILPPPWKLPRSL